MERRRVQSDTLSDGRLLACRAQDTVRVRAVNGAFALCEREGDGTQGVLPLALLEEVDAARAPVASLTIDAPSVASDASDVDGTPAAPTPLTVDTAPVAQRATGLRAKAERVTRSFRDSFKAALATGHAAGCMHARDAASQLADLRRHAEVAGISGEATASAARDAAIATDTIMDIVESASQRSGPRAAAASAAVPLLFPRTESDEPADESNCTPLRLLHLHMEAEQRLSRGLRVPHSASDALVVGVSRGLHGGPSISNDRAGDVTALFNTLGYQDASEGAADWEALVARTKGGPRARGQQAAPLSSVLSPSYRPRSMRDAILPATPTAPPGVVQLLIDFDAVRGVAPLRQRCEIQFGVYDCMQRQWLSEVAIVHMNSMGRPMFSRARARSDSGASPTASAQASAYSPQWCQAMFANVPAPLILAGHAFIVCRVFREGPLSDSAAAVSAASPADSTASGEGDTAGRASRDSPASTASSGGMFSLTRLLRRPTAETAIFKRPVGVGVMQVPRALALLPDGTPHRPEPCIMMRPTKADDRLFLDMHVHLMAEQARSSPSAGARSSPSRGTPDGDTPGDPKRVTVDTSVTSPTAADVLASPSSSQWQRATRLQPLPVVMRAFSGLHRPTVADARNEHLWAPRVRLGVAAQCMLPVWIPFNPLTAARSAVGVLQSPRLGGMAAAQPEALSLDAAPSNASVIGNSSTPSNDAHVYARSIIVTASPALTAMEAAAEVRSSSHSHAGVRAPPRRKRRRDDLYITLRRGSFLQDKKLTARNVQVRVYVVEDTGHVLPCMYPGVRSDPGDGMHDSASAEYKSTVYYHCNQPVWDETLCVRIPSSAQLQRCHVLLTFWHASSTLLKTHMFAFAFLPLTGSDDVPIRDGKHELRCFKPLPLMERGIGSPVYLVAGVVDALGGEIQAPAPRPPRTGHGAVDALLDGRVGSAAAAAAAVMTPAFAASARQRALPASAIPAPLGDVNDFGAARKRFDAPAVGVTTEDALVGRTQRSASDATANEWRGMRPSAAFVAGANAFGAPPPLNSAPAAGGSTLLGGMLRAFGMSSPPAPPPSAGSPASTSPPLAPVPAPPVPMVTRLKRRASVVGALALAGLGDRSAAASSAEAELPVLELRRDTCVIETRLVSERRSNTPEIHTLLQWRARSSEELVHAVTSIHSLLREPSKLFRSVVQVMSTLMELIAAQNAPWDLVPDAPVLAPTASQPDGIMPPAQSAQLARRHKLLAHALRLFIGIMDKYFASVRPAKRAAPAPRRTSVSSSAPKSVARGTRYASVDAATFMAMETLQQQQEAAADGTGASSPTDRKKNALGAAPSVQLPVMSSALPPEYARLPVLSAAMDGMYAPRLHSVLLACMLAAARAACTNTGSSGEDTDSSTTRASFVEGDGDPFAATSAAPLLGPGTNARLPMTWRTVLQLFRCLDVLARLCMRSVDQHSHELANATSSSPTAVEQLHAVIRAQISMFLEALHAVLRRPLTDAAEWLLVVQCAIIRQLPTICATFLPLFSPMEVTQFVARAMESVPITDWRQSEGANAAPLSVCISLLLCARDVLRLGYMRAMADDGDAQALSHGLPGHADRACDACAHERAQLLVPVMARILLFQLNASTSQRVLCLQIVTELVQLFASRPAPGNAPLPAPHWSLVLLLAELSTTCMDLLRRRAPAGEMLRRRRRHSASSVTSFALELLGDGADEVLKCHAQSGAAAPSFLHEMAQAGSMLSSRMPLMNGRAGMNGTSSIRFTPTRGAAASTRSSAGVEEDCRALPVDVHAEISTSLERDGTSPIAGGTLLNAALCTLFTLVASIPPHIAAHMYATVAPLRHILSEANATPVDVDFLRTLLSQQLATLAHTVISHPSFPREWLIMHISVHRCALRMHEWTARSLATWHTGAGESPSSTTWARGLSLWRSFVTLSLSLQTSPLCTLDASSPPQQRTLAMTRARAVTAKHLGDMRAIICDTFRSAWGSSQQRHAFPTRLPAPASLCAPARLALADVLVGPVLDLTHSSHESVSTLCRDVYFDLIRAELTVRAQSSAAAAVQRSSVYGSSGNASEPSSARMRRTSGLDERSEDKGLPLIERLSIDAVDVLVQRRGPSFSSAAWDAAADAVDADGGTLTQTARSAVTAASDALKSRGARVAIMEAQASAPPSDVQQAALAARRKARNAHESYVPPKDNLIMSLFAPRSVRGGGGTAAAGSATPGMPARMLEAASPSAPPRESPGGFPATARASQANMLEVVPSMDGTVLDDYRELLLNTTVIRFLGEMRTLYTMLISVSKYPATPEFEDERTEAALTLIAYLRRTHRVDMYLKYVSFLSDLHGSLRNAAEAAMSHLLFADILDWSPVVLPPVRMGDKDLFPEQSSAVRMESVLHMVMDGLEAAQCWESALDMLEALYVRYTRVTFEFSHAAVLSRRRAALLENVASTPRVFSSYFAVSYMGTGFPDGVRDRMYVYRGSPGERIVEFEARLMRKWAGATKTPFKVMDLAASVSMDASSAMMALAAVSHEAVVSDESCTMEIGIVALTVVASVPIHAIYDATPLPMTGDGAHDAASAERDASEDVRSSFVALQPRRSNSAFIFSPPTTPSTSKAQRSSGMVPLASARSFSLQATSASAPMWLQSSSVVSALHRPALSAYTGASDAVDDVPAITAVAWHLNVGQTKHATVLAAEAGTHNAVMDDYIPQLIREGRLSTGISCFVFQRPFRKRAVKTGNDFLDLWIRRIYLRVSHAFPTTQRRARVTTVHEVVLNPAEAAVLLLREKNLVMVDTIERAANGPNRGAEQAFSSLLQGVVDAAVSGGVANYKAFMTGDFAHTHPEILEDMRTSRDKAQVIQLLQNALAEHVCLAARGIRVHAIKCAAPMLPLHEFLCKRFETMQRTLMQLGIFTPEAIADDPTLDITPTVGLLSLAAADAGVAASGVVA